MVFLRQRTLSEARDSENVPIFINAQCGLTFAMNGAWPLATEFNQNPPSGGHGIALVRLDCSTSARAHKWKKTSRRSQPCKSVPSGGRPRLPPAPVFPVPAQ